MLVNKNLAIYDIIIVGGGIAGIYMARKCLYNGMSVLLIEKNDRFGGRIHTIYNKGQNHDLQYESGPARISKHHHRALKLINDYKLATIEITAPKKYRHVNSANGIVSKQNDISSKLILQIIKTVDNPANSTIYTKKYLQSIIFQTLCTKILGHVKATQLQHMFGYDAEFTYCNAYDAIRMFKRDFQEIGTYIVLSNGLSSLIKSIEDDCISYSKSKTDAIFHSIKNTEVIEFNSNLSQSNFIKVATNNGKIFDGRKIVWAIPQKELFKIKGWSDKQVKLFDSVSAVPLHRIFCQFPYDKKTGTSWLSNIERTTTNDALRQFIPLVAKKGFAQVSYSDSYYANYWKYYRDIDYKKLINELFVHFKIVFPEISNIVPPIYTDSQYWPEGVHMWKMGVNSEKVYQQILSIGELSNSPMYIVGEAYSMHQCWIEGALESVDNVFTRL
jgi:hypothetical protein